MFSILCRVEMIRFRLLYFQLECWNSEMMEYWVLRIRASPILDGGVMGKRMRQRARTLRKNMTDAEGVRWKCLRNRQLGGYICLVIIPEKIVTSLP